MVARSDALSSQSPGPHLRAGTGTPLVLVHGFLGGAAQWEAEIAKFSDHFDVIAPDLPGFGAANELPPLDRVEAMADYVIDLLDKLGIASFALLGHSMGGMIVQAIAAKIPDRIDRLILYATGPLGVMPNRFETLDQSRSRLRSDGVSKTIRRIGATWFLHYDKDPGLQTLAGIGDCATLEAALRAVDAMEFWDGRDALEHFPMQTLVLWGDTDRSYRWSQIEKLWQTVPKSSLAVVPGTSHAVHLEKPILFHAILKDFLDG